jgi:transcriptional regulator with XRE-family HTH domain
MVHVPRLREVRERKLVTQEELAEKTGISRATISRIEVNNADARISTVRKLAQALGVDAAELMAKPNA